MGSIQVAWKAVGTHLFAILKRRTMVTEHLFKGCVAGICASRHIDSSVNYHSCCAICSVLVFMIIRLSRWEIQNLGIDDIIYQLCGQYLNTLYLKCKYMYLKYTYVRTSAPPVLVGFSRVPHCWPSWQRAPWLQGTGHWPRMFGDFRPSRKRCSVPMRASSPLLPHSWKWKWGHQFWNSVVCEPSSDTWRSLVSNRNL